MLQADAMEKLHLFHCSVPMVWASISNASDFSSMAL